MMARASVCTQCRAGIVSRPWSLWSRQSGPTITRLALGACVSDKSSRAFHSSAWLRERRADGLKDALPQRFANETKLRPVGDASSQKTFCDIGFAFDIDGVLYQGHQGVPGAREMLRNLRAQDMRYVFLTNGGGVSEDAKAASLTKRLKLSEGEDVIGNRIILSHTPMRGWDEEVKRKGTVLITGSDPDTARKLAVDYGFERSVTPADLIAANGKIYPFSHLRDSLHAHSQPLPDGKIVPNLADPFSKDVSPDMLKIDQILVWNDPRDWSLDVQVIHDLLISHKGYMGTISDKNGNQSLPNSGWQQDGQPDLWISNLDLFWRTEYPVNRFGTGAFVDALKGVWASVTGGADLQYNALGKPFKVTYQYAHDRLLHPDAIANIKGKGQKKPLRRVYMIGDNPDSDIRGANEFKPEDGTEWLSILVKTGVWKETALQREPGYKPAVIVEDVVDAIVWAMRNEGVDASREWVLSGGK